MIAFGLGGRQMQLLTEAGKELAKKTGAVFWMIAAAAIFAIFVGLLAFGYKAPGQPPPAIFTEDWSRALAWEVGKLGITGGVVAVFIRMFHSINFLEAALERIMWSDPFLARRNDIDELWFKLTLFKYRQWNLDDNEQSSFLSRLKTALQSAVGEQDQIVRRHHRVIIISSFEERSGVINITEHQTYEVLVKNRKKFLITTRVSVAAGMDINEYKVTEDKIHLFLGGEWRDIKQAAKASDGSIETTYELSGETTYELKRVRKFSWPLDKDPVLSVTSRHICDGFDLEVRSLVPNLKTIFKENGIRKCFESRNLEGQAPGDQRQICRDTLLPGNGFSLFFKRTI